MKADSDTNGNIQEPFMFQEPITRFSDHDAKFKNLAILSQEPWTDDPRTDGQIQKPKCSDPGKMNIFRNTGRQKEELRYSSWGALVTLLNCDLGDDGDGDDDADDDADDDNGDDGVMMMIMMMMG